MNKYFCGFEEKSIFTSLINLSSCSNTYTTQNTPRCVDAIPLFGGKIDKSSTPGAFCVMENEVELWADVPGYEGLYQASTLGRVKSIKKGILSQFLAPDGYYKVNLCKGGKLNKISCHKVIWDSFNEVKSDGHKLTVDHKDDNRLNNRLDNLQLLTNRANVSKSWQRRKKTSQYTGVSRCGKTGKWVAQCRIKNKTIKLGLFEDELSAHKAYLKAVKIIDGNYLPPVLFLTSKSCDI